MNLHRRINAFIQRAEQLASECGLMIKMEPYMFGDGVQITWFERRQDDRVNPQRFLGGITRMADQSKFGLQLSLPHGDPQTHALFRQYDFHMVEGASDKLTMERRPQSANEPMAAESVTEDAPPGAKAERFITKHKKDFRKRYGKRWKQVLYATAWKHFGEGASFKDALRIMEALDA